MKGTKTLREMCDALGVKRRAVQGYEKLGLVSASGKNKYGYLLYDDKSQERIRLIKDYQMLGFKLKEIKELIDAPQYVIKEALQRQMVKLQKDKEILSDVINMAESWIESIKE